jgi:hypothetical protein
MQGIIFSVPANSGSGHVPCASQPAVPAVAGTGGSIGELGIKFGFGPDKNAGSRALKVL